jgi:hypothetical protein
MVSLSFLLQPYFLSLAIFTQQMTKFEHKQKASYRFFKSQKNSHLIEQMKKAFVLKSQEDS